MLSEHPGVDAACDETATTRKAPCRSVFGAGSAPEAALAQEQPIAEITEIANVWDYKFYPNDRWYSHGSYIGTEFQKAEDTNQSCFHLTAFSFQLPARVSELKESFASPCPSKHYQADLSPSNISHVPTPCYFFLCASGSIM